MKCFCELKAVGQLTLWGLPTELHSMERRRRCLRATWPAPTVGFTWSAPMTERTGGCSETEFKLPALPMQSVLCRCQELIGRLARPAKDGGMFSPGLSMR